ncbi:hypothetical protein JG688_00015131 [Phytophthora aleatoria]|uniref:Mitochondrial Carrier (MC) Family n=1 Tax=Phytophthora aleatoria TaxID=2496075 RepID=A0A8J5M2V9_9STRA|nr:hypothetical protein JG688_00015131 [Phytophthora aleatoria]
MFSSSWKMIAQHQLAARKGAEIHQTQLCKAIGFYGVVLGEFQRLFHERLRNLNDFPHNEDRATTFSQHKKIRFGTTDTEIFAAYIKELDAVYAQTDKTLQAWRLESTDANWDAPSETWDEDPDTGYFQFREWRAPTPAAMESFLSDAGADERSKNGEDQAHAAFFARFPHLREFFCGGSAAAINIVVTFPPNKVMFRQQLFGLNTWQAFENVRSEGWLMLYRGVKPPLVQAMVSKSIMFGLYNFYDELLLESFGERRGLNLVAAGLAGTSEAVLAPFERAQTLLQTPKFNREIAGAYDAMVHINKGPVRDLFPRGETAAATMTNDFICGAMLGAVISTFTFPINVARTRMQSVYGQPFIGPWEALQLTYKERGHSVRRLYRGVQMNFFRSLMSWGIINSTYEKLKSIT